jgi:hypothetical protein
MIQKTTETTPDQKALSDRIEEFYCYLNEKQWSKCFELVDPKLRESGKVELIAYSSSLSSFFAKRGPMAGQSLGRMRIYTDASNKNDDRDFAYGDVTLEDRDHRSIRIRERWVKASDGQWYTRMAGMV